MPRDGEAPAPDDDYIPEGFYLIVSADEDAALGHEIIEAVRKVTPISTDEKILGYPSDRGIIVAPSVSGRLCRNFASKHAAIAMTTEIYPDKAPVREAEDAQLAAVKTAIEFALGR